MILLDIRITGDGLLTPQDLPRLIEKVAQTVPGGGAEPVVIGGRLPVWAYGALIHYFHPRPWVGTFEPRLQKAVVVATHQVGVTVGDLIEVDAMDPSNVSIDFP